MADSAEPAPPPPSAPPARDRNPLKRLYHWILSWANHPWGSAALAVFAFLDSFVFPIPPLFLQVALSLERPKRSFWYATVDTVPSVLGAAMGWYIGHAFWDTIGIRIVGEVPQKYQDMLHQDQFLWTVVYSFIPLPFKVITLGSGLMNLSLPTLLIASTLGRAARFYALGVICFFYGNRAKDFIERHFNRVCLIVGVALAIILVIVKVVWKR
jgi:membrane protein YqaA with SNARE-associated domain